MLRWVLLAILWLPVAAKAQPAVPGCPTPGSIPCVAINQNYPVPTAVTPSPSATIGIVPLVAGSAASSGVLKASPGNFYSAYATVTAASWLMIFNSITAPSNGSTTAGTASGNLQDCLSIPSGSASINYAPGPPEVFSVGITAVISSTACGTLTLATTGYIHGSVQ